MADSLKAKTFGSENSPHGEPQPLMSWSLALTEEELEELRVSVVREFRRRYEEHGLSELIEIKEYLSDKRKNLRRKGREFWDSVSHLQAKVHGVEGAESPTEREKIMYEVKSEKAGKMNGKAEVVEYRLSILKNVIWNVSVNGDLGEGVPKSTSNLGRGKKVWRRTKAAIISVHEEEDIREIPNWNSLYRSIKIKESNERGEDAIRRQLDRRMEGGRPDTLNGMIDYIENWKEEEDVNRLARRYTVQE